MLNWIYWIVYCADLKLYNMKKKINILLKFFNLVENMLWVANGYNDPLFYFVVVSFLVEWSFWFFGKRWLIILFEIISFIIIEGHLLLFNSIKLNRNLKRNEKIFHNIWWLLMIFNKLKVNKVHLKFIF